MSTVLPRSRVHRLAAMPEDERRALILKTAADLFADQGYGGTSTRQIAEELGIRAPSLYTYYPSKRQILEDLALSTVRRGNESLRAGLALEQDVTARLIRGMEAQVRFRLEFPTHMIAMTREMSQLSPEVRRQVLDIGEATTQLWVDVIRDGIEAGRFAAQDAYVTALVLGGLCSYVQVKTLWVEQHRPAPQLIQMFSSIALKVVAAD